MNVRIIANPVAGGGRGRRMAEALRDALDAKVSEVELVLTKQAGDNEPEAARPGADIVVAVGGDGSVNEVVNGLKGTEAALAILPAGTANVVSRELRIPKDPEAVAAMIIAGHTREMDAGLRDGRRFMLGAGAGLDAAITEAVSQQRGKKSNLMKWVGPSIKTCLSYDFPKFKVIADGDVLCDEGQYAIIGNCRYSAGVFPATPEARIDDGLLDVCILQNLSVARLIGLLPSVARGRHILRKDVIYKQFKTLEITPNTDQTIPFQVDGDPGGCLPVNIGIEPRAVRVICPPAT
jgi:diacylglycerol kinase (ATP)